MKLRGLRDLEPRGNYIDIRAWRGVWTSLLLVFMVW